MSTNFQLKSLDRMSLVYSLINQSVSQPLSKAVSGPPFPFVHTEEFTTIYKRYFSCHFYSALIFLPFHCYVFIFIDRNKTNKEHLRTDF